MNLLAVARKETLELRRSKTPWVLSAVVSAILAAPILTQSGSPPQTDLAPVEAALTSVLTLGSLLLPLPLLVASYDAVTGEVETGRVTYLLGLPNTRLDAVAGKLLGRSAVAALGVAVAFVVGAVLAVVKFGHFPVVTYLTLLALTLYFAAVWTAVGVGVSAFASTRGQALAGALGAYLLFVFTWVLPVLLRPRQIAAYLVESVLGLGAMPAVYDLVFRLSPSVAYAFAGNRLVSGGDGPTPLFLEEWAMLLILLGWLAGPIAVGYLRFRDTELAG